MKSLFFLVLLAIASSTYTYAPWLKEGLNHTYHPGNAYSQYYTWAASVVGRIELSFKTSIQNATLIYIEGRGQLLHVALLKGRIKCSAKLSSLMQGTGSEVQLNDDQWHRLELTREYDYIIVMVDDKKQIILKDTDIVFETGSPLYIGGIPPSTNPSIPRLPSFAGCIKDLRVGNLSYFWYNSFYEVPVFQNMTSPGCVQPCDTVTCSKGETCNNVWSSEKTLCSCTTLHRECLQSVTNGPVVLDGTNYHCYDTVTDNEPHIDSYLFLHLKPPYPPDGGVLLTFHRNSGPSALLYIANSKPHFTIYKEGRETSTISLKVFLLSYTDYKLSILRNETATNITLRSEFKVKSVITEEFAMSHNEEICLGRGTAGFQPYKGTVVNILQQGHRMSHKNNNTPFYVSRLEHLPGDGCKHLSLQHNTLSNSASISFRVWMESPGYLINAKKGDSSLNVQLGEGSVTIDNGKISHACYSEHITKNTWLSVSLVNDKNLLSVFIDHVKCITDNAKLKEDIHKVLNAPINIGTKPLKSINGNNIFRGYIEGIMSDKGGISPICPVVQDACTTDL